MSSNEDTELAALEAIRAKNVADGNELLLEIRRVEERQSYWKSVLEEAIRVEAEQDERTTQLTKDVLIEEASSMTNVAFLKWMAARKGSKFGSEAVAEWYHNDELSLETPYAAMVPLPRQLSKEGSSFFCEALDDLLVDDKAGSPAMYLSTLSAFWPQSTLERLVFARGATGEKSAASPYTQVACRNGADVLRVMDDYPESRLALQETPCAFLMSKPIQAVAVAKVVVVGGLFVAAQASRAQIAASCTGQEEQQQCEQDFEGLLQTFVKDVLLSAMPMCTFLAVAALVAGGGASASRPKRWVLLTLGTFSGAELEHFSESDVQIIAQTLSISAARRTTQPSSSAVTLGPVIRWVHAPSNAAAPGRPDGIAETSSLPRLAEEMRRSRVVSDSKQQAVAAPVEVVTDALMEEDTRRSLEVSSSCDHPAASASTPPRGHSTQTLALAVGVTAAVTLLGAVMLRRK